jgi:hypothetical protein
MTKTEKVFPTKHLIWVDKVEFDNFLAAARTVVEAFPDDEALDHILLDHQIESLNKLAEFVGDFDPAKPVPTELPTEPVVEVHADGAVEVQ